MKKINPHFSHTLFVLSLLLASTSARAWDGVVGGKIVQIHTVATVGNADTRVYLVGYPAMCNAPGVPDAGWAFINSNNPNYKGILANILTAYALGKTVTFYSNKSSATPPVGYCEIGYMVMTD
jgi:hypothetical protein